MRKWLKWEIGRQKSGYDKMLLATGLWPLPFDFYVLRFPTGSKIEPHVDEVQEKKHFRLNIVMIKAKNGGEFVCDNPIFETSRIKFFRPDISRHSVTEVISGTRYVLSIGWVR